MKRLRLIMLMMLMTLTAMAQKTGPEVTSWILNVNNATGYGGYATNVQKVRYSDSNVYVSCTCIPGYDIGPWMGNPNTPANQNFVFQFKRYPKANTGTLTATPLGHIGTWSNGVSMFNATDANSYNNLNVWHQNAEYVEGKSFDKCLGHPAPNGEYHHHVNPTCLYNDKDSTKHSPIIGYAFDGYPVYGAYGYAKTDGTGGITRMKTGYQPRTMTKRTTKPDGTALNSSDYGPDVSTQYPIGYYTEDFVYTAGSGDLDTHNGRFCVTPEYPKGTYAYFVTIDKSLNPAYPYTLGATYYGIVNKSDIGPASGHVSPTETVLTYTATSSIDNTGSKDDVFSVYPNPVSDVLYVRLGNNAAEGNISITDISGRLLYNAKLSSNASQLSFQSYPSGFYTVTVTTPDGGLKESKIIK